MREEDFRIVLAEWKARKLPDLVERELEIPLEPVLVVAIIGPRQAGKTFRMFQLIKELTSKGVSRENILYVNFEHERLRNLDANNLGDMMKVFYQLYLPVENYPIYLLLDEVQNVRDWDKWLRRTSEDNRFRVFISGSSSKLSSREIATSLRGRSMDFTILPFSFREFLKARKLEVEDFERLSYLEERGRAIRLVEEYVRFGGYPKIVLTEDVETKERILKSYYETIFHRDITERYRVDPVLFDAFLRYAVTCFAKQISISKIYNHLKTLGFKCSKQTLIKFLKYSEEVFFLFPFEIFSYSVKERRQYPKKIYIVDNGIVRTIYPEADKSLGRLMENTIAIELIRRKEGDRTEISYWREYGKRDGKEVDFVVRSGFTVRELIQATYANSREEIGKREIESLIKASEELKCNNLLIITWDYEGDIEAGDRKIKCQPLWKWLLKY